MPKNGKAIAGVLSVLALALAACGGRVDIELGASGSAKVRMQAKMEDGVVRNAIERIASFTGQEAPDPDAPLFDEEALRDALAGRSDIKVDSASAYDPDSVKAEFSVPDLLAMGEGDDGSSPFFALKTANGEKTLSFRLDRGNVARLPELFPVFDPEFIEILSPPALFGDDLSAEEYRDGSLALFIGAKNLPSVDRSAVEIRISPPGKILSQKGGKVAGNAFSATLPLLTALVLEKPYEFSLTWKE